MADRIMLVEDDRELRETLAEILSEAGYEVIPAPNGGVALSRIMTGDPIDLVVTDLVMPVIDGQRLLEEVRRLRPELDVVVMTAFGTIKSAIEMLRGGAYDYMTKPVGSAELLRVVGGALEAGRGRRSLALSARASVSSLGSEFVGSSPPMQELYRLIVRAASVPHAVLITGESGVGKELVARALHRVSGRRSFIAVNCGALPEHLLESELFGHEKGAFTSADRAKPGLFEAADQGTLFLDEISELTLALQPKLLRAIESGEIRRVGATMPIEVDVRLIAATNRDLEGEVREGRFREDLFWRLNVVTIAVPPLRDRREDVPALVEHFLAGQQLRIDGDAMALLTSYEWPGNVRELRNALQRAAVMATGPSIGVADLPPRIRAALAVNPVRREMERRVPLRSLERTYVLEVLREVQGNRTRAAEILGVDRKTLYRKLAEYQERPEPEG
jgi:DNA-binding NtrC family response regulator